jgi:hypothetical protein
VGIGKNSAGMFRQILQLLLYHLHISLIIYYIFEYLKRLSADKNFVASKSSTDPLNRNDFDVMNVYLSHLMMAQEGRNM